MTAGTLVAVALLVGVLGFAVARPRGLPEVVAAAPAAGVVVVLGLVTPAAARAELTELAPVVAFLAAVLVLAHLCEAEGLFALAGTLVARVGRGRPQRLLVAVFVVAALVTAVLSLDATVVLLTPVVFATAARAGVRPKPLVYACTHLANSGSLLLPVSNLTNLLALGASGLSFGRFAALMALPWLAVLVVEYVVVRRFFATDLALAPPAPAARPAATTPTAAPSRLTVALVLVTLGGFVVAAVLGAPPAWAAAAGALVLGARAAARRRVGVAELVRAANVPFCLFVLALGVLVAGVVGSGVGDVLTRLLPSGSSFVALLGVAAAAAVLANLLNNLPAVLVLAPLAAAAGGPPAVLAVLVGVNVGPNLTYVGSLATLLWRRVLHAHDERADLREYTALGAWSVPATLLAGVAALWVSWTVMGGAS